MGSETRVTAQWLYALLPAPSSVGSSVGPSFSPVGGVEGGALVVQEHGGALMRGSTPETRSKGGRVAAERRRARAERNEEIEDAVVGHVEKLSTIIGHLVEEARGEQYRCPECGCFGPKVSDH